MEVSAHVLREEAAEHPAGDVVKVKWARVQKGSDYQPEVRCRLVAQEFGYREHLGELFAATPSLAVVKILLSVAAEWDYDVTLLDVKCAFTSGDCHCQLHGTGPTRPVCNGQGTLPEDGQAEHLHGGVLEEDRHVFVSSPPQRHVDAPFWEEA